MYRAHQREEFVSLSAASLLRIVGTGNFLKNYPNVFISPIRKKEIPIAGDLELFPNLQLVQPGRSSLTTKVQKVSAKLYFFGETTFLKSSSELKIGP